MTISNDIITIQVAEQGAELTSLIHNKLEYIWQADPKYWKRHAPILFPIVGKVWDNTYHIGEKSYHLPQHGFARDSRFEPINHTPDTLKLRLISNADTLCNYPYPFALTASYNLDGPTLHCLWQVENPASTDMYFQIGAHPAFCYPDFNEEDSLHGHLRFLSKNNIVEQLIVSNLGENGCLLPGTNPLPLTDSLLPLNQHIFDHGALVLENSQADHVVMLDKERNALLEMCFDAPVLGIWSPQNAPFCCIEPWYGRADSEGFSGSIEQRAHIYRLAPHSTFTFRYDITIFN